MARGRFVNKKISYSSRVAALPEPAQKLYTWMITHLDRDGRMHGNARLVKQLVIPNSRYSYKLVENWLNLMAEQVDPETGYGLISRYNVGRLECIWMEGFDTEQGVGSWRRKETPSVIPEPPESVHKEAKHRVSCPPNGDHIPTEEIVDNKLKAIITCYESGIGQATPAVFEKLKDICDEYPDGWFKKAVKEAELQNKRNLSYVTAILKRWKVEGITDKPKKGKTDKLESYFDEEG